MQSAFHHIPVLFEEVMAYLSPRDGGAYADGTLGGGGHSEGILLRAPHAVLYGIDRDVRPLPPPPPASPASRAFMPFMATFTT